MFLFFSFSVLLQWEIIQRRINNSFLYTYSVCNVLSADQDHWLRTTFIQRPPEATRVSVELSFIMRNCDSFEGEAVFCKETFGIFVSEADADVGTNFRQNQFRKVANIAPTEVSSLKIQKERRTLGSLSRNGFYLAFQDTGACMALVSVRVYYKTCPSTVQRLAAFPETVANVLREVEGVCVKNAISPTTPRVYCTAEGEWVVPVGQCQCLAGYESTRDSCQGKYIHLTGTCLYCPVSYSEINTSNHWFGMVIKATEDILTFSCQCLILFICSATVHCTAFLWSVNKWCWVWDAIIVESMAGGDKLQCELCYNAILHTNSKWSLLCFYTGKVKKIYNPTH